MKKILIIIGTYSPGKNAGGPIESIKNTTNLLKEHFDFYIVTSNCDFGENEPYKDIKVDKWNVLKNEKIKYLKRSSFTFKKIKEILLENDYDLIYLQSAFCFKYTIIPLIVNKFLKQKKFFLIAPRGNLDPGALRLKGKKKSLYLKLAKILGIYNDVIWQATAVEEKLNILKIFPNANIKIMSNLKKEMEIDKKKEKEVKKLKLVHISRIQPKKNLLFFLTCLSKLEKNKLENIWLDIYGPIEDKKYWKKCLEIIEKNKLNCSYKGYLENDNVSLKISEYNFFVLPTLGENFGHVILESLIAKTPLLISDNTPWKDLEKKNIGYDLKLVENKWIGCLEKILLINEKEYGEKITSIERFLKYEYNLEKEKNNFLNEIKKIVNLRD